MLTEEGPTLTGVLVYSLMVLVPTSIVLALVLRQTVHGVGGIRASPAVALVAAATGLVPVQAAWVLLILTQAEAVAGPAIVMTLLCGIAAATVVLQQRPSNLKPAA